MLRKHTATIVRMSRSTSLKDRIREYFKLSQEMALVPAMYQRGLGQADLVLALLRIDHPLSRLFVESLIGKPILIGESCLLRYYRNGPPLATRQTEGTDRKITYVAPGNPRQPQTDAHLRWQEYRVGRTVGQLRVRGIRKRDIRLAVKRGWIRLEDRA